MGYFKFHRSTKLFSGTRLNMSKSGPSVSFGVKDARYNIGPQGTRTTLGIPGTGVSYISRSGGGGDAPKGNWLIGLIEFIVLVIAGLIVFAALCALIMWRLVRSRSATTRRGSSTRSWRRACP